MKKWLIILSVIFSIGFISSAVLAGRVYYQDLKNYTDYDKQELQTEALKNIYIKSSVPVEIYPTIGVPYVEFNQTFTDLVGVAPEYELDVQSKGENTYIELNETKELFLWLGVKEDKAQLSVYLPQATINRLNIQDNDYFSYRHNKQVINLEGINVNELSVDMMNEAEFILNGNYERIKISAPYGKINLKSNTRTQVFTDGSLVQNLSGEFDKITIRNNSQDIIIDSTSASNVEINNDNSNIDLKGSYSKVKIEGGYNNIDIRSESVCHLSTEGYDNYITGNGAFDVINLEEQSSEVEIQTTVIPTKVSLGQEAYNNTVSLTLPSNILGFTVKYLGDYYIEDEEFDYYGTYENNNIDLQSDFTLESGKSDEGEQIFIYGDGTLPILISGELQNSLEIIDGGYSSNTAQ